MSHLILPWSDLLHHEERDPDEPEAVAEVFEDDTRTDPPEVGGLEDSQEQVDRKGNIEDTDQREERLLQTKVRDIVAREDGAEDEGNRTCRTINQAIVLIGECYPALSDLILEEDRGDLHRKPFAQAIEEDEDQIEIDMLLLKE